jgi:hypothetical protein
MIIKNNAHIIPPSITVKETPRACERIPAIRLPKGSIPAKVNINALITLPLNSSLTIVCNIVFMREVTITLLYPTNIKVVIEDRYDLDIENNIRERENTIEDKTRNLPLCLKSPKRANNNPAINAPMPAADISIPKPLAPTYNISLANTGISIT